MFGKFEQMYWLACFGELVQRGVYNTLAWSYIPQLQESAEKVYLCPPAIAGALYLGFAIAGAIEVARTVNKLCNFMKLRKVRKRMKTFSPTAISKVEPIKLDKNP